MISVPPTALKVTSNALQLVDTRAKATNFVDYATLNREVAVVVDDEVVAGDLLVAASIRLGITHITVRTESGDADIWRRHYTDSGAAHGSKISE